MRSGSLNHSEVTVVRRWAFLDPMGGDGSARAAGGTLASLDSRLGAKVDVPLRSHAADAAALAVGAFDAYGNRTARLPAAARGHVPIVEVGSSGSVSRQDRPTVARWAARLHCYGAMRS